jgi:hypothetical protein
MEYSTIVHRSEIVQGVFDDIGFSLGRYARGYVLERFEPVRRFNPHLNDDHPLLRLDKSKELR